MYIDKARINIKAGDGGNGCTSFYTEKYVPNGGPDGGNGGRGGNVAFVATKHKNTLSDFKYIKHYRADNGENGKPRYSAGKKAGNLVVPVPVGTVIRDEETGAIIADMFEDGKEIVVLEGGMGGKGNAVFKNSRRQAPHFSQLGEKVLEYSVILELKTIADIGLVGYPNVGKSTLLSVVSAARPKIGSYHFTTLSPNLGMVNVYDDSFVVADIPGLIDGAGEGAGLGHDFLRHVERTRLLVHVIDASGSEGRDPITDFHSINNELATYNMDLTNKPQIVVLNKCDLLENDDILNQFKEITQAPVILISAATHNAIDELIKLMYQELVKLPKISPLEFEPFMFEKPDKTGFDIKRNDDASYELYGGLIDELARNVVLDSYDSMQYFQKQLKDKGINKALRKAGVKDGDTVHILDIEFEYFE